MKKKVKNQYVLFQHFNLLVNHTVLEIGVLQGLAFAYLPGVPTLGFYRFYLNQTKSQRKIPKIQFTLHK